MPTRSRTPRPMLLAESLEPGHVGRARQQADEAYERLQDSRSRVQTIDVAFTFQENDRDAGGSLLGGAIAFRLFLWLLPSPCW